MPFHARGRWSRKQKVPPTPPVSDAWAALQHAETMKRLLVTGGPGGGGSGGGVGAAVARGGLGGGGGGSQPITASGGLPYPMSRTYSVEIRDRTSGLPEKTGDVPILAYKVADIAYEYLGAGWQFYGVGVHTPYGPDDVARCTRGWHDPDRPDHPAPVLDCTCGFYALKNSTDARGKFLLNVELFGRVIVCERGYRAEKQRVLGVEVCTDRPPAPLDHLAEQFGVPFVDTGRRFGGS